MWGTVHPTPALLPCCGVGKAGEGVSLSTAASPGPDLPAEEVKASAEQSPRSRLPWALVPRLGRGSDNSTGRMLCFPSTQELRILCSSRSIPGRNKAPRQPHSSHYRNPSAQPWERTPAQGQNPQALPEPVLEQLGPPRFSSPTAGHSTGQGIAIMVSNHLKA